MTTTVGGPEYAGLLARRDVLTAVSGRVQMPVDGERLVRSILENHRRPCVVAMGVFDGIHEGHRALVRAARGCARARGLPLVAITFALRPEQVLLSGPVRPSLCWVPARVARLGDAGADEVIVLPFTPAVAGITAERFARLLIDTLGLRLLCVGEDFALGRNRTGDVAALRNLGMDVMTVPFVLGADGRRVSSSALRSARAPERGGIAA
jgi:riboflavin kinase/FMN adenylyltransferase